MAVTLRQAIGYAAAAGFVGEQIVTIVSISLCECGSQACGCNPDAGGVSCGVLQIYQPAHPGTAACAVDPPCAYRLAYTLSSRGANFRPWTTFNNGCWRRHAATVRAAMAAAPAPLPDPAPAPSPSLSGPGLGWAALLAGVALVVYAAGGGPPRAS